MRPGAAQARAALTGFHGRVNGEQISGALGRLVTVTPKLACKGRVRTDQCRERGRDPSKVGNHSLSPLSHPPAARCREALPAADVLCAHAAPAADVHAHTHALPGPGAPDEPQFVSCTSAALWDPPSEPVASRGSPGTAHSATAAEQEEAAHRPRVHTQPVQECAAPAARSRPPAVSRSDPFTVDCGSRSGEDVPESAPWARACGLSRGSRSWSGRLTGAAQSPLRRRDREPAWGPSRDCGTHRSSRVRR